MLFEAVLLLTAVGLEKEEDGDDAEAEVQPLEGTHRLVGVEEADHLALPAAGGWAA